MDPIIGGAVVGSAISAGGSLLGSGISSLAGLSKLQSKRWRRDQDWLAGRQYDLWKQQFDYESNYNSPLAQMQRLREAGLNPNLMYGEGNSATGNVAMSPVSGGSAPAVGFNSDVVAGAAANMMMQQAQIQNIRANTNKTNAEANRLGKITPLEVQLLDSRIASLKASTKRNLQQFDFFDQTKDIQAAILKGTSEQLVIQNAKSAYELNHILPAQKDYISNMSNSFYWRSKILETEFKLKPFEAARIVAQTNLFCAQAYKAYADGDLTKQITPNMVSLYGAQARYYEQLPDLTREGYDNAFNIAVLQSDTTKRGQNFGLGHSIGNTALGIAFLLGGRKLVNLFRKSPKVGFLKSSAAAIGIGTLMDFMNGTEYDPNNPITGNTPESGNPFWFAQPQDNSL